MTGDEARRRYDEFYRRSLDDSEAFWLEAAGRLDWTRQPDRALELREPPTFAWFPGGRTNLSTNALDRHVYRLAVDATGLPPERIGFVTANGWDAAGAGAFGFRVAWLRTDPAAHLPAVGAPEPAIATWPEIPAIFGVSQ